MLFSHIDSSSKSRQICLVSNHLPGINAGLTMEPSISKSKSSLMFLISSRKIKDCSLFIQELKGRSSKIMSFGIITIILNSLVLNYFTLPLIRYVAQNQSLNLSELKFILLSNEKIVPSIASLP